MQGYRISIVDGNLKTYEYMHNGYSLSTLYCNSIMIKTLYII